MTTVTLTADSKYGFSGQYIAKLIGRAPRVQFEREFCGRKSGKRNESTRYETDEPGLYETADVGKHGKEHSYWLVLPWDGQLKRLCSDHEDALAIAKRLGDREELTDIVGLELGDPILNPDGTPALNSETGKPRHKLVYTIRSKVEVKRAAAAETIDSAVAAIVAALQALPAPQQKAALAAAKSKLFPKVNPEPESLAAELL